MIFHIFICIFHFLRVYPELTKWPAPRWLDSSVGRAQQGYRRGHGFESRSGLNYFQPRSRAPLSSYLEKAPWLRLVTCLYTNQIRTGVGSKLSMEEKVALSHRRNFESLSKLFVRDPAWPVLRLYQNFLVLWVWDVDWEGSLLIFTTFLNNREQLVSD